MVVAGHDRGDEVIFDGDEVTLDCFILNVRCIAFCSKVITSIGASERSAYSTAFLSSASSNITASKEPDRRTVTVSRLGGALDELSSSSSKSTQEESQAK